ncbi:MAG: transposase [Pseudomonas sp.]|uniref:REP-associated tyrosine transposase n=1 Tax=Pseudomonas sp. TaxID=306 RepID=UPI00271E6B0C|nr:transposase [Pseudomonas sp.]MDO9619471.1 transposase [Pseudomonas sp.]MDP2447420.1 transposase [Pseudomonas sp.]MDZ4336435.1 transposase [Pseudomonas sp.]
MVNYRRMRVAGGTYFFTLTLKDRRSDLLVRHIDLLRDALRQVKRRRPFTLSAVVVMPDHVHLLLQLPETDTNYSARLRDFKMLFVKALRAAGEPIRSGVRGDAGIWQARFWEHTIRDERDLAAHIDYIHFNSVKHGHVSRAVDWPYSSFHRYVRQGLLSGDWAGGEGLELAGDG